MRARLVKTCRQLHSIGMQQVLYPRLVARQLFLDGLSESHHSSVIQIISLTNVTRLYITLAESTCQLARIYFVCLHDLLVLSGRNICGMNNHTVDAIFLQLVICREAAEA